MLGFLPLFGGVADASHGQPISTAEVCPEDAPDEFTDDEGNAHEDNINCIAFWEITVGITATQYGPRQFTKRDQMASFIARLINTASEAGGAALPSNAPDAFTDDETSVHEDNINRLAAAGVVRGTSPGKYSPRANVTRGQMASFIAQAIDYVNDGQVDGDQPPATTNDHFTDDEQSVHESNINRIAEQHIVVGIGGGRFSPDSEVFRDQMASFLAQAAAYLETLGFWPPIPVEGQGDFTDAPELQSASVVDVDTTGTDAGTTIAYVFDEPIEDADNPGEFLAYTNDLDTYTGDVIASISENTVLVFFNDADLQSQAGADALTVATVDFAAVQDAENVDNPIGDAPLNADDDDDTAQPAGVTAAPDLTDVTVGTEITPNVFETIFTFDETVATVNNLVGFHIIDEDGVTQYDCTAQDATPESNEVDTECDTSADPDFVAGDAARGFVDSGAVQDAAANDNPLQAAEANDDDGNTPTPDLVSAQFFPSAGTGPDQVAYTFDEPIDVLNCALFVIYYTDGSEDTADDCEEDSASVVVADFGDEELENAVGASVMQGAVDEASLENRVNQEDEVGVSNEATDLEAGKTIGPDLIEVNVDEDLSVTGTVTGVVATYTFDEDVDHFDDTSDFFLHQEDGTTRYQATNCDVVDPNNDPRIECDDWQEIDENGTVVDADPEFDDILTSVLGTVDGDNVSDDDGNHGPEGAEPVTEAA